MPVLFVAAVLIVLGLMVGGLHILFTIGIVALVIGLLLLVFGGPGPGAWNNPWRR